jgi:RDD family
MRRGQGLRLRLPSRPSRQEHAPLWRRFAAETVDGALEIGCRVAWRVLDGLANANETAPKLTERVGTALREVLEPHRPDETARPRTPEERNEFLERLLKDFLESLGRAGYWTAERAVSSLVAGLILRAGPMILTGGQTPGQVLLNVRVVSADGQPITARQALVREFGYSALFACLDLLPLPAAARGTARLTLHFTAAARLFHPHRRPHRDLLAGTRVLATA